ncbi:TonB-dependent receptor domain-containing protein [Methylohalobius crimeensis]|uniref:TonB-dependent receptor domain-containing protein n=1 Tax=Methylohalobius crimeensis TaxID=244365 RepID=UPI0003B75644|nr:TonB-dependent receptor [Methylohalobius crimeensis]
MMNFVIRTFLWGLLWLPIIVQATEGAHLQLYLFLADQPLAGAQVYLDGDLKGVTDKNGALWVKLSAGEHRLELRSENKTVAVVRRRFKPNEDIQILITTQPDGSPSRVAVESSATHRPSTSETSTQEKSAPPGTLAGRVIAADTGKPIAGAEIYLSGLEQPLVSDKKGRFTTQAPTGNYSLSVTAGGYNMLVKENISINTEHTASVNLELTPAGVALPPYIVIEPHLAGSVASAITQERSSTAVTNILGAEQISRAGDSDVASALKRVSGVTIVDGKYAYIRGLGERYSNVLVNSINVPSPNPTRRVVPLDFFPSGMLDSLNVQKSFSVDMPAEFAGGVIDLQTRSVPDDFLLKFSGKIGFKTGTTFDDGATYNGGDYDWIGVDDGTRDLPDSLAKALASGTPLRPETPFSDGFTPEEIEQFGESFSNVWEIDAETIPPDGRISGAIGDKFHFGDFNFGFYALGRWDQSWQTTDESRRFYTPSSTGLQLTDDFEIRRTVQEVNTNAYLNVEADYQEDHKVFGRVMLVRQTTNEARGMQGFSTSNGAGGDRIRTTRLWYVENELFNWQAGTEHTFKRLNDLWLRFLYSGSTASRSEPNQRRTRADELGSDPGNFILVGRNLSNNQIIFGDLEDEDDSWRLDLELPFQLLDDRIEGSLASGYWTTERYRDSGIRRFSFDISQISDPAITSQSPEDIFTPENISPEGAFLKETTRTTDSYTASQALEAYFGQLDVTFFNLLRLTGGVRFEDNLQTVETVQEFTPGSEPITSILESRDALPSVALTWLISDKQQLRLTWSETLSRPDFRELSPAPFIDPETDLETTGNPNLQQAEITSYDARWEYYFSPEENVSFGLFYKELIQPIEKTQLGGTANVLTFQNAGTGEIYGLEIAFRKNLDFIHPWLNGFFFGGNYTLSESEIKLLPENLEALTNPKRPLQGHSKHIVNARLGYDNEDLGTQATLLYNFFSPRISQVGALGAPDIYRQPFHQLDFIVQQNLDEHWSAQLRFRNLLDSKVKFSQGSETTREYRKGREFALAINFAF